MRADTNQFLSVFGTLTVGATAESKLAGPREEEEPDEASGTDPDTSHDEDGNVKGGSLLRDNPPAAS